MDVLSKSKDEDLAIFRAHVNRTLKNHANDLKKTQDRIMSGFKEGFWKDRTYTSSDISLKYTHNIRNRFVDMKRRTVGGRKVRNVNRAENHNKFIMGHYAGIMGDLTYGLTENMKNRLREDIKQSKIVM